MAHAPRRGALTALLREPFAHFALGGLALFAAERLIARRVAPQSTPRPRIVVRDAYGPVDAYVRDEALYREALRLRLDQGDAIVRRRLVQKMEFLLEAQAVPPAPTDDDLRRYLDAHAETYRRPPRVSFEQLFFTRDRRADAEGDAHAALAAIAPDEALTSAVGRGDPYVRGPSFPLLRFAEVTGVFGYDFARAVDALPAGRWSGPFASAQGWHLVRVVRHDAGGVPALADVRDDLRRAWSAERSAALQRAAERRIVERYEVVRVPDDGGPR